MDFNDAFDKAKFGFEVICKKTEDVVAVSKLKIEQAKVETRLSKNYQRLGKLYYNALTHGKDADAAECEALTELITENRAELRRIKAEILEQTSKRKCEFCSALSDKDAEFCSKCGEKF